MSELGRKGAPSHDVVEQEALPRPGPSASTSTNRCAWRRRKSSTSIGTAAERSSAPLPGWRSASGTLGRWRRARPRIGPSSSGTAPTGTRYGTMLNGSAWAGSHPVRSASVERRKANPLDRSLKVPHRTGKVQRSLEKVEFAFLSPPLRSPVLTEISFRGKMPLGIAPS